MKTKRILGAMGTGAAASLFVASAALAGTNSATSTTTGASAKFIASGDSITVCDTSSDGHSVYAQYRINGGATHSTSVVSSGSGTCVSKSTGNPAEGSTVSVRAVRSGAGNTGAWVTGVA
jgi:hypothetical protein